MKKEALILFLILILIINTIGCTPQAVKKAPLKIGLNTWAGYAHAFVAKEKGIFQKNDVDVELVLTPDYTQSITNFKHGALDGIFEVYGDRIIGNTEGIDAKVVYIVDYSTDSDVIIGKPEFSSMKDLRGKRIGIENINTFSHMLVLSLLKKEGVPEAETQFVKIPAMDVLTALNSGTIDAGHTWEPIRSQALAAGYKQLGKAGDVPGTIIDVLTFKSEVINTRAFEVQAVMKSLFEALDYVKANPEESLKIMADAEKMTTTELQQGLNGVHQLSLDENMHALNQGGQLYTRGEEVSTFYLEHGQFSSIPDLDAIIEPRFINNLIR
jgi:NitT/TauT family transport system substrate-binding protein